MDESDDFKDVLAAVRQEIDDVRSELKDIGAGNLATDLSLKNVNLALNAISRQLDEIRSQFKILKEQAADLDQVNVLRERLERIELNVGLDECDLLAALEPEMFVPEVPAPLPAGEKPPFETPAVLEKVVSVRVAAPAVERNALVCEPTQSQSGQFEPEIGIKEPAPTVPDYPAPSEAPLPIQAEPQIAGLEASPDYAGDAPIDHVGFKESDVQAPRESLAAPERIREPDKAAFATPVNLDAPHVKEFDWAEIESKAAVWGTRVGVLIVVMGLAYLLSIGFSKLGVLGKACIVYMASIGMLATGVVFEKLERYSTWAKIMIAGGWAAVYITTFMIHYIPEARLIHSPSVDMFLLAAIAAGMIAHSFRYRSQSLTILTYFIAFATIILSIQLADGAFFSLVATTVLALSMLVLLYVMQWHRLALFCLVACYATHVVWATRLIPTFRLPTGHGTEFWAGLTIILLYLVHFYGRRAPDKTQRQGRRGSKPDYDRPQFPFVCGDFQIPSRERASGIGLVFHHCIIDCLRCLGLPGACADLAEFVPAAAGDSRGLFHGDSLPQIAGIGFSGHGLAYSGRSALRRRSVTQ